MVAIHSAANLKVCFVISVLCMSHLYLHNIRMCGDEVFNAFKQFIPVEWTAASVLDLWGLMPHARAQQRRMGHSLFEVNTVVRLR